MGTRTTTAASGLMTASMAVISGGLRCLRFTAMIYAPIAVSTTLSRARSSLSGFTTSIVAWSASYRQVGTPVLSLSGANPTHAGNVRSPQVFSTLVASNSINEAPARTMLAAGTIKETPIRGHLYTRGGVGGTPWFK